MADYVKLAHRLKIALDSTKYQTRQVPRWNVYNSGGSYKQGKEPNTRPLLKTKGAPTGPGKVYPTGGTYKKKNISVPRVLQGMSDRMPWYGNIGGVPYENVNRARWQSR